MQTIRQTSREIKEINRNSHSYVGEVHFWMCCHELLQNVLLLRLVRGRSAHLLLALVKLGSRQTQETQRTMPSTNVSTCGKTKSNRLHCARTIIFSTVLRVSPSKSDNLLFSGSTLAVLISGSPTATRDHQCILLFLASKTVMTFLPFSSSAQSRASMFIK